MRFNAQKHQRGMHCLVSEQDHQVLARARLKGLNIHPSILESAYLPTVSLAGRNYQTPGKNYGITLKQT